MKITKSMLEAALGVLQKPVNQHSPKGNYVVESYEAAERHHDLAKKHKDNPARYAEHMQKYHEMSAEWSRSKGRHRVADQHDAKAELFADDLKKHKALKEDYVPGDQVPARVKGVVKKVHATLKKHGVTNARVSVQHHKKSGASPNHHVVNIEVGRDHIESDKLVDALHKHAKMKDAWKTHAGDVHISPCASIYPSPRHVIREDEALAYDDDEILAEAVNHYESEAAAKAVADKLSKKHADAAFGHGKHPEGGYKVTHSTIHGKELGKLIGDAGDKLHEEMSDDQKARAEHIVKNLKADAEGFKKRYGVDWEGVMYATANKMAMKEEVEADVLEILGEARYGHLARGESSGRHYKDEHGVTWDDEGHSDHGHVNWGRGPQPARKHSYAKPAATKHYHEVPYAKKEDAKKEGMKWHAEKKKWYHTDAGKSATSKFKKLHEEVIDEAAHPDTAAAWESHMREKHFDAAHAAAKKAGLKPEGMGYSKDKEHVHIDAGKDGEHKFHLESGKLSKLHEEELSEELRERLAANAAANKNRTPIAGVDSTKKTETKQGLHRVAVTVSDPNHPAVSQRKETVQKFVKVRAGGRFEAEGNARRHYQKQGYKVHDVNHHSEIKEEVEGVLTTELFTEEHATREAAQKRLEAIEKKHPLAKHSVIQGRRTGKWHVVRHTSGGMHVVEGYEPEFDELIEDCGLDSKGDWQNYKSEADKKAKDNIKEGDESEADYQAYLKSLKDKKDKTKSTIKSVRGK